MALHIYSDSSKTTEYSEDGAFTQPITIIKNGSVGTTQTLLMYLGNDSAVFSYINVTIQPTPDSKIGENSLTGWRMKVLSGVNGIPSEDDWDSTVAGSPLYYVDDSRLAPTTFPNDTSYVFPFYVRLFIPAGTPVQQTRAVKLVVNGTQV